MTERQRWKRQGFFEYVALIFGACGGSLDATRRCCAREDRTAYLALRLAPGGSDLTLLWLVSGGSA